MFLAAFDCPPLPSHRQVPTGSGTGASTTAGGGTVPCTGGASSSTPPPPNAMRCPPFVPLHRWVSRTRAPHPLEEGGEGGSHQVVKPPPLILPPAGGGGVLGSGLEFWLRGWGMGLSERGYRSPDTRPRLFEGILSQFFLGSPWMAEKVFWISPDLNGVAADRSKMCPLPHSVSFTAPWFRLEGEGGWCRS